MDFKKIFKTGQEHFFEHLVDNCGKVYNMFTDLLSGKGGNRMKAIGKKVLIVLIMVMFVLGGTTWNILAEEKSANKKSSKI